VGAATTDLAAAAASAAAWAAVAEASAADSAEAAASVADATVEDVEGGVGWPHWLIPKVAKQRSATPAITAPKKPVLRSGAARAGPGAG